MSAPSELDTLSVNTIRTLAMDAIQAASSGHPGAPMGLAPVAYVLWQRHLRYDPAHPLWPNRDRFVLSAGHASMLLYPLIHLAGVRAAAPQKGAGERLAVTMEDIKAFRQLHSPCAGHPEHGLVTGVETTTGPLGQGAANSVGMAIASRFLAARYNRPGHELFDFDVYAILGDGCMEEGISSEAASQAGHLKLGNLCWVYDSNRITIEGSTDLTFTEDVAARFEAYGWRVLLVPDANDLGALDRAFSTFHEDKAAPTLIVVKSQIAHGSPNKQGSSKAHGEPLGADEIRLTKAAYGWPEDSQFLVPQGVREHFAAGIGARGAERHARWQEASSRYALAHPGLHAELGLIGRGELPEGWDSAIPSFPADPKGMATRAASGKVLNAIAPKVPWLLGGSADLAPSTKTWLTAEDARTLGPTEPGGRNIHFGVREHAMGAIANGMALAGLRAYDATFLVFADYMRTPIRLGAMMELPVIHVFTHDSIGVGEDGPTHQPVEHLATLRAVPGLLVLRPADASETAEAWRVALSERRRPSVLVLSRQDLPTLDRTRFAPAQVSRGGYVLCGSEGWPEVILVATGSEVSLCVQAWERLASEGVRARVVSLPCWELFDEQPAEYRESVLPSSVRARVAVELGSPLGWERYAGPDGGILGMRSFGASAPFKDLLGHFGFTVERILEMAREQMRSSQGR
ncbi:MAG: transketolase [Polyangia bacterium]|nr:transketolase [Polyangia bacterium]